MPIYLVLVSVLVWYIFSLRITWVDQAREPDVWDVAEK